MKRNKSLFLLSYLGGASSLVAQEKTNLLVIMTDEHNFRTLGCYRETMSKDIAEQWGDGVVVETPNIDRLAKMGVMCLNHYAVNPVSSPSRSTFFTGMYPQKTKVVKNDIPMDGTMCTFAQTLQENGYRTAYLGKWHLDGNARPGWEPRRKFGFQDNRYMFNRGHWKNIEIKNGNPVIPHVNEKGVATYGIHRDNPLSFTTDFLVDKSIEFIKQDPKTPFCCVISIPDPHGPNSVRTPYDSMYMNLKFSKPKSAEKDMAGLGEWAKKSKRTIVDAPSYKGMAAYYGMVKCIDDNVGKILAYLEKHDLLDNTMIVFTSDHGDLLGEHGRDNKSVPYEASAKVPFIVTHKESLSPKVVSGAMNNADFTPTVLSLLGIKSQIDYQGNDYSSLIKKGDSKHSRNQITVFRGKQWIAAFDGRYKLILSDEEGVAPILFDLKSDPNELNNIFSLNKDISKRLAIYIKSHCVKTNEPLYNSAIVKSELERLTL